MHENIFDSIPLSFFYPLNFNMFSFFNFLGHSISVFKNLFLVVLILPLFKELFFLFLLKIFFLFKVWFFIFTSQQIKFTNSH